MSYPVAVEIDYVERRSRLTTFFRWLLAIPQLIWAGLWGIAVFVVVVIAWFALLFTARWPQALYDFVASYLRFYARVNGYVYLAVDPWPPFDGGEDPEYPLRLVIAPPLERYSRLKVFFRPLYVIPALIVVYFLSIVLSVVGFLSWLVIIVLGRQPAALQDVIRFCLTYNMRANALMYLVTQTYPPFSDEPAAAPSV